MGRFRLVSDYAPAGDQPQAIEKLARNVRKGVSDQVLLGVTGSGKTFTMANVVERVQRPTLVISHNKTLAAQLYTEFKTLFPENAVHFFVSYYDYYQPEAYVPPTDTYIEKDSSINEEIDKLRLSATNALFERDDVLIVASVSCIYGLGSPEAYYGMLIYARAGRQVERKELLDKLDPVPVRAERPRFLPGKVQAEGGEHRRVPRLRGGEGHADRPRQRYGLRPSTPSIPSRGKTIERLTRCTIFPATHYVTPREKLEAAVISIEEELVRRLKELRGAGKLLEAQRLEARTKYDLEMLREIGYCQGIENYSRHLTGRKPGEAPPTLMDYIPKNALVIIDESHVSVPQIQGMYRGDRSRKETLVEYGFRLPSALDNRPLTFEEFQKRVNQVVYVSATPATYELTRAKGHVVEQIVRPTGLDGPDDRGEARPQPGGRPARGGEEDDRQEGEDPHHDADEAVCRRPDGLPPRRGHKGQISPLRGRYARKDRHCPRPAARKVRRPRGRQPAQGRARPAGGLPRGHPGR